ncbi:hypothetical protein ACE193_19325 [Bernardetia sp. OM2101]|uniref:hypothetical protein n=1 Tax=Bernardetia sp. OM2101 TaxID=3344876 RepID=UPI0035D0E3D8
MLNNFLPKCSFNSAFSLIKTLDDLEKSRENIGVFESYDILKFSDIELKLPVLDTNGRKEFVKDLISYEETYLESELTRKLYKNSLLQVFRNEWKWMRNYEIYPECYWGGAKLNLKIFSNKKVGLSMNDFAPYKVGYFAFPKKMESNIFTGTNKSFEFEMTTKLLGRNPKTITKKYRTLPKEGQKLKPFDYEEIK